MRILEKKGYTYRRKQIFLSTDAPPKTLIFSQDPVPSPPLTATSYTTNNAAPDITSTITFDASANTLAQIPACTSTSAPSTAQAHTAHDAAPTAPITASAKQTQQKGIEWWRPKDCAVKSPDGGPMRQPKQRESRGSRETSTSTGSGSGTKTRESSIAQPHNSRTFDVRSQHAPTFQP